MIVQRAARPGFVATLLLLAVAGAPDPSIGPRGAAWAAPPAHVPGRVVVRLRGSVVEPADLLFSRQARFADATADGNDSLDRLNRTHRVRSIRPVLPPPEAAEQLGTGALPARRLAARQRVERARQRRLTRGRRAPAAAAPPDLTDVYVLEVPDDADVESVARAYAADPHVAYATPDYVFTASATPLPAVSFIPDDTYVEDPANPGFWREGSWGLATPDLWGLQRIRALEAWNDLPDPAGDPGAGVVVAVVDSGLDYAHPDAGAVWTNAGEIPANGVDDDGNGYVDDVRGFDFTTISGCGAASKARDADPFDDNGHGSHVSGTVAAAGDNGIGVVGVAPQATVQIVKGLDDGGCGTSTDLAAGIVYAADNGADVVNMSWGGDTSPPVINDALEYAHGLGLVLVAAAGNAAVDTFGPYDPSPMNSSFVVTVSALDPADALVFFSNFGQKIDVGAPGGRAATAPPAFNPHYNVLSLRSSGSVFNAALTVGGDYLRLAGTSMAAPHVAGVAALVLAAHPGFTNEDVRQVLHVSADDVGAPGFDPQAGYGRVNAQQALAVTSVPSVFISSPRSREPVQRNPGVPVTIAGTAAGPGFASYQVLLGVGNPPGPLVPLGPPSASPVVDGPLATWDASDPGAFPAGLHTLVLRVTDDQARVFESRRTIVLLHPSAPDALPGWPIADADSSGVHTLAVGDVGLGQGVEVVTSGYSSLQIWSDQGENLRTINNAGQYEGGVPSLGDLDGDPALEIVIGDLAGIRVVDEGAVTVSIPQSAGPAHPVVLDDMDGDGSLELVSVDFQGQVFVRRPDGSLYSPAWPVQPVVPLDSEYGVTASDLAVGDLDGDGTKEILVALADTVTNSNPANPATPFVVHALGLDGSVRWTYATPFSYLSANVDPVRHVGGADVVLGDVDADGWLETVFMADGRLSIPSNPHFVVVLDRFGQPKTEWTVPRADLDFTAGAQPRLVLSDLDGDWDLEIVTTARRPGGVPILLKVFAWHHDGTLVSSFPASPTGEAEQDRAVSVLAADVDGDGAPDLVTTLAFDRDQALNRIYAWDGAGQSLAGWPHVLLPVDPFAPPPRNVDLPSSHLADLDGNGTLDMVVPLNTKEVQAVDLGVPVAADALQWPTHRHDLGRTGRFEFDDDCGNGTLDPGEQCDDGNRMPCDGCDGSCQFDVPSVCGDGATTCGEECDDGNTAPCDGCSATCDLEEGCGDGEVACGEECDDGNANPEDGCTNECTVCGNSVVTAPETCDVGAGVLGDCCDAGCRFEPAGNPCIPDAEQCTDDVCDGVGTCTHQAIPGCATGDPGVGIEATTLRLRDGRKRHLLFVSRPRPGTGGAIVPPPQGQPGDPTLHSAFVQVHNSLPGGPSDNYGKFLNKTKWSAMNNGGYRYRGDKDEAFSRIIVAPGRVRITAGGESLGYTLDEPAQGRITLRLYLGLGSVLPFCAEAPARTRGNPPSTARYDRPGRFDGERRAPAPPFCPD